MNGPWVVAQQIAEEDLVRLDVLSHGVPAVDVTTDNGESGSPGGGDLATGIASSMENQQILPVDRMGTAVEVIDREGIIPDPGTAQRGGSRQSKLLLGDDGGRVVRLLEASAQPIGFLAQEPLGENAKTLLKREPRIELR